MNAIHQESQLKVDIHVAGGTPFDQQQLQRRTPVALGARRVADLLARALQDE